MCPRIIISVFIFWVQVIIFFSNNFTLHLNWYKFQLLPRPISKVKNEKLMLLKKCTFFKLYFYSFLILPSLKFFLKFKLKIRDTITNTCKSVYFDYYSNVSCRHIVAHAIHLGRKYTNRVPYDY